MEYVRRLRSPAANWRYAFELASLIQHDPKIGSDPVLLGELTDLLSHELDKPERRPRADPVCRLDAGGFQNARGEDRERSERRPAGAAGASARAQVSDQDSHRRRRQPGQAGGPHEWPARRRRRRSRLWARPPPAASPKCARWPSMPWGFSEARRRPTSCASAFGSDEDRFVRYNAAVGTRPPRRPSRRGHAARDALDRRPQQGDRPAGRRPRSRTRSRRSSSRRSKRFAPRLPTASRSWPESLRSQITDLTKSGLVSVRSQALELLQSLQAQALIYTLDGAGGTVGHLRSALTVAGAPVADSTILILAGERLRRRRRSSAIPAAIHRRAGCSTGLAQPSERRSTHRYRHKTNLSVE